MKKGSNDRQNKTQWRSVAESGRNDLTNTVELVVIFGIPKLKKLYRFQY